MLGAFQGFRRSGPGLQPAILIPPDLFPAYQYPASKPCSPSALAARRVPIIWTTMRKRCFWLPRGSGLFWLLVNDG
jgi:hypothetical protein